MRDLGAVLWCAAAGLLAGLPGVAATCESLREARLPGVTITRAERMGPGTFTPPYGSPIPNLPAFCRVAATLRPTQDSDIKIEVWMPESGWNGRFEGTGNGGFAGKIAYGTLAGAVRRGAAVANTDMGMAPAPGSDVSAFADHPEKWADWGWRATHEVTVASKQLVRAYYGRNAQRSYFAGCSTGGEQALMEAQRYPDDYDGILAGAAANNRTGVHTSILWNYMATQPPHAYIPEAKLNLLAAAVLDTCDATDGLKDGLIADPRPCRFDPAKLPCHGADQENCLTAAEVQTARAIYEGPVNPRTKEQIYPGVPAGTELDWTHFGPPPGKNEPPPFEAIFKWGLGKDWNWRTFRFDRDFSAYRAKVGPSVDAMSPDLSAFEARGHKLIVYHGWADWLVVPGEALRYRDAVLAQRQTTGGKRKPADVEREVNQFYRLFLIPGMAHCGGGPGLNRFDGLNALVNWVERDIAPDQIVAVRYEGGKPENKILRQRPICPYPQVARYRGTGSLDDAASFTCVAPERK
ncbi:MAG TPA: tannase/feruloyl esterase family alpha/beta hydrolase [Bryobacteraceae bacterium]|nr:tannase/feruloyl esterase family alpha/beta hydrolase [Bryobacteraceae bacterium]